MEAVMKTVDQREREQRFDVNRPRYLEALIHRYAGDFGLRTFGGNEVSGTPDVVGPLPSGIAIGHAELSSRAPNDAAMAFDLVDRNEKNKSVGNAERTWDNQAGS